LVKLQTRKSNGQIEEQLMRQIEKKINQKNDEFEKNRIHHPPFNLSTIQPINQSTVYRPAARW